MKNLCQSMIVIILSTYSYLVFAESSSTIDTVITFVSDSPLKKIVPVEIDYISLTTMKLTDHFGGGNPSYYFRNTNASIHIPAKPGSFIQVTRVVDNFLYGCNNMPQIITNHSIVGIVIDLHNDGYANCNAI